MNHLHLINSINIMYFIFFESAQLCKSTSKIRININGRSRLILPNCRYCQYEKIQPSNHAINGLKEK